MLKLQNILAGSLFGLAYGFPLTCLLTSIGATNCYLLSAFCARAYVQWYFGKQLHKLTARVNRSTFCVSVKPNFCLLHYMHLKVCQKMTQLVFVRTSSNIYQI